MLATGRLLHRRRLQSACYTVWELIDRRAIVWISLNVDCVQVLTKQASFGILGAADGTCDALVQRCASIASQRSPPPEASPHNSSREVSPRTPCTSQSWYVRAAGYHIVTRLANRREGRLRVRAACSRGCTNAITNSSTQAAFPRHRVVSRQRPSAGTSSGLCAGRLVLLVGAHKTVRVTWKEGQDRGRWRRVRVLTEHSACHPATADVQEPDIPQLGCPVNVTSCAAYRCCPHTHSHTRQRTLHLSRPSINGCECRGRGQGARLEAERGGGTARRLLPELDRIKCMCFTQISEATWPSPNTISKQSLAIGKMLRGTAERVTEERLRWQQPAG